MELQELYGLMDRFAASGLTALEWEKEGERVSLHREQPIAAAACERPSGGGVLRRPRSGGAPLCYGRGPGEEGGHPVPH